MNKLIAQEETEGEMNMCKALEDFYQEGKAEGIIDAARRLQVEGKKIVELLMEELQIEEAKAKEYINVFKTKNPS